VRPGDPRGITATSRCAGEIPSARRIRLDADYEVVGVAKDAHVSFLGRFSDNTSLSSSRVPSNSWTSALLSFCLPHGFAYTQTPRNRTRASIQTGSWIVNLE